MTIFSLASIGLMRPPVGRQTDFRLVPNRWLWVRNRLYVFGFFLRIFIYLILSMWHGTESGTYFCLPPINRFIIIYGLVAFRENSPSDRPVSSAEGTTYRKLCRNIELRVDINEIRRYGEGIGVSMCRIPVCRHNCLLSNGVRWKPFIFIKNY